MGNTKNKDEVSSFRKPMIGFSETFQGTPFADILKLDGAVIESVQGVLIQ